MSQGVLQAIFEYQTAICELTGMDVSNASGYDGTTVAADACFVAKHATGRSQGRPRGDAEPAGAPGREDVRAGLRARGRRGAAPRRRRPTRTSSARRPTDAACVIFQQPNFFGCLEPAPDLAAAANDAGALAGRARRPDLARRARGARATTAARSRSARGRRRATTSPTAARTTASSPRASDYIRRMPGRIVGETTDADGRARLCPHAADPRAAHPPREGDLEHHDEPDAARARRARPPRRGSGPQGLREVGETCMRARASTRRSGSALPLAFPDQATFKEFAVRARTARARGRSATRASTASTPATRSAATTQGMDDALLVARHREADARPTSTGSREVLARGALMELIYEKSQRRAAAPADAAAPRASRCPSVPDELRRARAAAAARGRRARARPPLHRALADRNFGIDTGFYPLGSCTMKHNPRVNERVVDAARLPRPPSAPGGGRRAGRARADVAPAGDPRRGRGPRRRLAAAGGRLAGRADRADAHARVLRRPRRGEQRDTIITADTAHGTNPASVTMAGYELDEGRDRRARQPRPRRPARRRSTSARPG